MTIGDIKQNRIPPFDTDDDKLKQLFSFFFSSAPTISSAVALEIDSDRLQRNWDNFMTEINIKDDQFIFLSSRNNINNYKISYKLNDEATINRKCKGFVCKRANNFEKDYECVLRHIRNSIGHSNVYVNKEPKRKYILFEDFNPQTKAQTAIILFSQTDLSRLKQAIVKY